MTYTPPTVDRVLELFDPALDAKGEFPPEVFTWLQEALRAHVDSAGKLSIEECLGLKVGPRERSIARRYARSMRNSAMVDAWRAIATNVTPWRRCDILLAELAAFEAVYWPKWQIEGPEEGASRLRLALYDAMSAPGEPLPRTTRGVFELLKRLGELNADADVDSAAGRHVSLSLLKQRRCV